jgi:ferric-dicitrate binding protein FerR (iron transport regulator)
MINFEQSIRAAQRIADDIEEHRSLDVAAAYRKVDRRIRAAQRKQQWIPYIYRAAAILVFPLMVSTLVLTYFQIHEPPVGEMVYHTTTAAPGTVSRLTLPDGSNVWLNAGSSLRYPLRFADNERSVHLTGEGYFEVESDAAHPFFVALHNGMQVKATGTHFNISAYDDDEHIEVVLQEGKVDCFLPDGKTVPLVPDKAVVFLRKTREIRVDKVNADLKIAWKDGRLIFRNATIEEVIKSFSRWYNVDIVLHKQTKKEYKFRATFSTETVTQALNYMALAAPLKWRAAEPEQKTDSSYKRQQIDVWLK